MKYTVVKEIPERRKKRGNIEKFVSDFLSREDEIILVDWRDEGYKSPTGLRSSLSNIIKRKGFQASVTMVNGEVYLFKTNE